MKDIKTLKAYASARKLPKFKHLANLNSDWLDYAYEVYRKAKLSNNFAKEQREKDKILGTEIVNYEKLTKYYNQYFPSDFNLPSEYNILTDVHHLRFGVLDVGHIIPFHIDEPFTLRGLCVIKGQHRIEFEGNEHCIMNPGELYYINGAYRHSIINTASIKRIALLNKFNLTPGNIECIITN